MEFLLFYFILVFYQFRISRCGIFLKCRFNLSELELFWCDGRPTDEGNELDESGNFCPPLKREKKKKMQP